MILYNKSSKGKIWSLSMKNIYYNVDKIKASNVASHSLTMKWFFPNFSSQPDNAWGPWHSTLPGNFITSVSNQVAYSSPPNKNRHHFHFYQSSEIEIFGKRNFTRMNFVSVLHIYIRIYSFWFVVNINDFLFKSAITKMPLFPATPCFVMLIIF